MAFTLYKKPEIKKRVLDYLQLRRIFLKLPFHPLLIEGGFIPIWFGAGIKNRWKKSKRYGCLMTLNLLFVH